jgi:hypothetical protein
LSSLARPRGRARRLRQLRAAAILTTAGLVLAGALVLSGLLPGPAGGNGASAAGAGEPTPQTDASVPAHGVTMIGATPEEPGAPGSDETWGVGHEESSTVLVRYFVHPASGGGEEGSWTLGPALPSGFKLEEGPIAGQMTPRGDGVLAGTAPASGRSSPQVLLVRKPGGAFAETKPVLHEGEASSEPGEPQLKSGEELFGVSRAPLIAPLEEADEQAGALVVPIQKNNGVEEQVLHWDGHSWTREQIAIPAASKEDFRVLAIGASSPGNAWLLAQLSSKSSYPFGSVALFRRVREGGEPWSWEPVALTGGSGDGEAHPLNVPLQGGGTARFTVAHTGEPPTVKSQLLTVTSEGVWVDGERADVTTQEPASATLFFKPEGSAGGQVAAGWCWLPPDAPAGTPQCQHELPEALPSGFSRSVAWANGAGPFGARVITGLPEGVSLRLEGETFTRVLALGAGSSAGTDPGAERGAAFSSPTEGWLGVEGLPVHLTTKPAASRLTPWPTAFRHPLLAVAPEPGAPVGALSSEALAVGDKGAVARFKPGQGWLPESLFGPGQRVENPRLRAVAWPTPGRAYAVGDKGEMWLWRGETGLWEKDPATPVNFTGNLLGIAFDPSNSARGYAVGTTAIGQGGVLLRYGKSWTAETALPAEAQGAAFTSIAFAGSEAIVAFRKQPNPSENRFAGGLLVNSGSGWQVDSEAASVMGSGVPEAVAGLPDGGAAFATTGGSEGPRVFERQGPGAPWQATPTPLPGSPGSLALFREGAALRAVVSGGGVGSPSAQPPVPPGSPPVYFPPLPPQGAGLEGGGVLRQTAAAWSDETHEQNSAGAPAGGYTRQDLPYRPDPILAVLVNPAGTQGWAIGGIVQSAEERLETGDVERYPADGVKPAGTGEVTVPLSSGDATFAIGGGAQCAAPCADRSRAGIGPQVWLQAASALARKVGTRAFLYTGPYVTEGQVSGPRSVAIPFARELQSYGSILGSNPAAYPAASPQDLDARPEGEGTEALFESEFAGFPQPLGNGSLAAGLSTFPESQLSEPRRAQCANEVGCQAAYYALDSHGSGGSVRVIVLDESSDVGSEQLAWVSRQLAGAASLSEPAIVIGNVDLNAHVAAGEVWAAELARMLVGSARQRVAGASAYFYDSPEENVQKPLRAGSESIPTFGSGTLGYVDVINELHGNFHGASGILLAQVELGAPRDGANRAPVSARLIPVVGELAIEAQGGTLLRRSLPALFAGLARRPRAGGRGQPDINESEIDPYIPIPTNCVGECSTGLFPEYTFTSSNPEVGEFVKPNLATNDPLEVEQNAKGEPIPDAQSGLFCPYNPGTTIVTVSAGGLSASLPVTVEAGSVRQPCGTQPLKNRPTSEQSSALPPPPPPSPAPAGPAPASSPPPVVPVPPAPAAAPAAAHPPQPPAPHPPVFIPLVVPPAPLLAFVPPPVPTPARPTPPTGTSAVTSPVEMAEREEEHQEAPESASNQAVAYVPTEHEPSPVFVLGIVTLAAFAGATIRRRMRGGRRTVSVAPATITTMRAQRRL